MKLFIQDLNLISGKQGVHLRLWDLEPASLWTSTFPTAVENAQTALCCCVGLGSPEHWRHLENLQGNFSLFKAASRSFKKKGSGVGRIFRKSGAEQRKRHNLSGKDIKGTTMTRKPEVNRWAPSARGLPLHPSSCALSSCLQEPCLVLLNQPSESLWCI